MFLNPVKDEYGQGLGWDPGRERGSGCHQSNGSIKSWPPGIETLGGDISYQSLLLSEALIYQYNLGSTLKANATAAAQGRYQFPMQSAEEVAETFGLSNTGSPARDITIWAQQIQRRFAGHSPYISSLCSAPPSRCILNLEWRDQTAARPFDQVDIDNESQVPKVRMTTAIALKDPAPRLVHPDKKPDTADHILAR